MVAITGDDLFLRSKEFFKSGDIRNTIETYEKAISYIDRESGIKQYISFLKELLKHCQKNNLKEEEALIFRALGRTFSVFKKYPESLKYHWLSLKIQRKLGKKLEVAESLKFIAEDSEVSGNYEESIKSYKDAMNIFKELGKKKEAKKIKKEILRLQDFSKEILEEDFIRNKFNIDDY